MTLLETHPSAPRDHSHLGELALRRFRVGELTPEKSAEVEQHVSSCNLCRTKLRGLADEQRSFEREIPFERFAGGVERARRVPRQAARHAWSFGLAGFLAAAAVAVFFIRAPTHTRNIIKGASVEATIRIASDGGASQRVAPPGSHEVLDRGDRIRLGYKTGDARFLAAVSVDEQGDVTPLYPEAGPALAVAPTQETVYLPDSIEFTGSGRERVFLFLARNPFDALTAKQAVAAGFQASKGDLDTLPSPAFSGGQDVFSWLFKKP
jgi:hypothetical protein